MCGEINVGADILFSDLDSTNVLLHHSRADTIITFLHFETYTSTTESNCGKTPFGYLISFCTGEEPYIKEAVCISLYNVCHTAENLQDSMGISWGMCVSVRLCVHNFSNVLLLAGFKNCK